MPEKAKEESRVPASLIPVKEKGKEELLRGVGNLNPKKIKNSSDVVRSKIPSSKYDRTKYATAKYAPTVECSTKYEVTVDTFSLFPFLKTNTTANYTKTTNQQDNRSY